MRSSVEKDGRLVAGHTGRQFFQLPDSAEILEIVCEHSQRDETGARREITMPQQSEAHAADFRMVEKEEVEKPVRPLRQQRRADLRDIERLLPRRFRREFAGLRIGRKAARGDFGQPDRKSVRRRSKLRGPCRRILKTRMRVEAENILIVVEPVFRQRGRMLRRAAAHEGDDGGIRAERAERRRLLDRRDLEREQTAADPLRLVPAFERRHIFPEARRDRLRVIVYFCQVKRRLFGPERGERGGITVLFRRAVQTLDDFDAVLRISRRQLVNEPVGVFRVEIIERLPHDPFADAAEIRLAQKPGDVTRRVIELHGADPPQVKRIKKGCVNRDRRGRVQLFDRADQDRRAVDRRPAGAVPVFDAVEAGREFTEPEHGTAGRRVEGTGFPVDVGHTDIRRSGGQRKCDGLPFDKDVPRRGRQNRGAETAEESDAKLPHQFTFQ